MAYVLKTNQIVEQQHVSDDFKPLYIQICYGYIGLTASACLYCCCFLLLLLSDRLRLSLLQVVLVRMSFSG